MANGRIVFMFVCWVFSMGASAALSFYFSSYRMEESVRESVYLAHVNLWKNHLVEYRSIERLLLMGCFDEALEKTRIEIDLEMRLLSNAYKESPDFFFWRGLDSNFLLELRSFRSSLESGWFDPVCQPASQPASQVAR